jgi:ElaB/YqjD/DUF883 family membrane-anchored ribosome-binding protein
MANQWETVQEYVTNLSQKARELVAATGGGAGDRVTEARKQLEDALSGGRELLDQAQKKATQGVKYTDHAVRENPYIPIVGALVLGVFLALLFRRRDG